jgi:hypothetical protein
MSKPFPFVDVSREEFYTFVSSTLNREDVQETIVQGTNICAMQLIIHTEDEGDVVLAQAIYTKPINLIGVKVLTYYQLRKELANGDQG